MSSYKQKQDPYPFSVLSQKILRGYLIAIMAVFPMMMDATKYSQITKFKFTLFVVIFSLAASLMLLALILHETTRVLPERKLTRGDVIRPPFAADAALAAYWVFMLFSTIGALDRQTALQGMTPRNNGFVIQTMYIITYFILAHGLKPKLSDAFIFVWGGALFGGACILHFFGVDLYHIESVNPGYGGPVWDSTKYRFLGPMGNVNLGSYVLAITAIIAAGAYIKNIRPSWDRRNISTAACFAVILFAELNINTDAGLVALVAAILLIPPVLCRSLETLTRTFHIGAVSAAVLLFNELVVEVWLREGKFGTTGKLLLVGTAALTAVSVFLSMYIIKKVNSGEIKAPSSALFRRAGLAFAVLAVAAGVTAALVVTAPDPAVVGSVAGAPQAVDRFEYAEKTDTVLHEFGQILRGNFDDDFGHNRLFTWKRSLRLVELRPLLGIGPDNFRTVFAYYFGEEAKDQFPSSGGGVDKAHNEFLDVLVDNGILGFVIYLAFFGALLYYALRNSEKKTASPVFGIAVAGYMAHAFFGYQLPIQSPCMWVMIGTAAAFIRSEDERNRKSLEELEDK